MIPGLILVALASAPASGAEVKLAAPGLHAVQLPADLATFYSDHLAQQLLQHAVRVITAREIQAALGLERQRQLLNCSDTESSCMTELANALGVDGLITGSLGKFGSSYQVNLKILSARDLSLLASFSSRVKGEEPLLDELAHAAKSMSAEVLQKLGRPLASSAQAAPAQGGQLSASAPQGRVLPWVAVGAGTAMLAGGALFYGKALEQASLLSGGAGISSLSAEQALMAKQEGQSAQVIGTMLGLAGLAGVTTGVVLLMSGSSEPAAQPLVAAGASGVWVGVTGRLP